MAYRTRSSSTSSQKAQFFILSAFIMITILFVVSQFIQPAGIFDTSSAVLADDIYTFNNIKEKAVSVVKLSESCSDLGFNLNEYKDFLQNVLTQKNERLVFNFDTSACTDQNLTTKFYMALSSPRGSEDATFTVSR